MLPAPLLCAKQIPWAEQPQLVEESGLQYNLQSSASQGGNPGGLYLIRTWLTPLLNPFLLGHLQPWWFYSLYYSKCLGSKSLYLRPPCKTYCLLSYPLQSNSTFSLESIWTLHCDESVTVTLSQQLPVTPQLLDKKHQNSPNSYLSKS